MAKIGLIDYGMGNLFSVRQAFKRVNQPLDVISDVKKLNSCDALILPGVGAFDHAMHNLKEKKLDYAISNFVETGKPFLGICLGMQLIMEESSEFKTTKGLGLVKGNCLKFDFQKKEKFSRFSDFLFFPGLFGEKISLTRLSHFFHTILYRIKTAKLYNQNPYFDKQRS